MKNFKEGFSVVAVLFISTLSLTVLQTQALAEAPDAEKSKGVIPQGNPSGPAGVVAQRKDVNALADKNPASPVLKDNITLRLGEERLGEKPGSIVLGFSVPDDQKETKNLKMRG
ncbi:MAG: hypothetical protein Q7S00_07240, partial [bacterium]|nr:hypothetical protein [bacterium]